MSDPSSPTYRALLVGNSTFPSDPHNLPDLEGPRNDPALLRDALCDDRYGLFKSDNVRLVTERLTNEILEEIDAFLGNARHDDTLLLYYSGHGRLGSLNELYLCARNSRVDRLGSTAVRTSNIRAMINDSAAATTIIVLDCCHSGAFKGGGLAETLAGRGRFVMTSCRSSELARDSLAASNRASLFTHHLVQGMLGQASDPDGDGLVVIDDLYRYAYGRLTGESRQIPEKSFAGIGDVPVARRPVPPATPILDIAPTKIMLDEVDVGEQLPPEHVAIMNRGHGELAWSFDCRSDWVTIEPEQHGLLIYLRPPRPGINRANIHVRDDASGQIKTVRINVHAVAPATPPAADGHATATLPPPLPPPPPLPLPVSPSTPYDRQPRPPDWRWNARHSLWLLSTLPVGLTTWAGFLYIGVRAHSRSWQRIAIAYGVVTLAFLIFIAVGLPKDADGRARTDTWQNYVGVVIMVVLWFGGIIHGLIVNIDWLNWRAHTRETTRP
jgi:hypothetical protein